MAVADSKEKDDAVKVEAVAEDAGETSGKPFEKIASKFGIMVEDLSDKKK